MLKLQLRPLFALGILAFAGSQARPQGVAVLTRSYDNQRSGANLGETTLNTTNVNASQFGKLFSLAVDDQVFAGLLYVPAVQIAGATHNVIYAATSNNSVFAFDADTMGPPLWQTNYNGSARPVRNTDFGICIASRPYTDFRGNIGIVGTPVIDGNSGTIYFVTRTVEAAGVVQRLRALDITTGKDRPNSPQVIQASVPGTGDGGVNVVFNPSKQNQRAALALSAGVVYIAWGSYCDFKPYHGWMMAYDASTLAQVGVFNTTPRAGQAGIWMAGAGIAFDADGNLYASTGNGGADGSQDFGESLVKLAPGSLALLDFYTASNFNTLNNADTDFGSGGPTLLPGTNMLMTGGKEGRLYVLNTGSLGHLVAGDVQVPQIFQAVDPTVRPATTHHIHSSSPIWNSPEGLNAYIWGENDYLHGYHFSLSTQTFTTTPFATASVLAPWGMPGGVMSLSANGSQAGTGILWAATPRNGDANLYTVGGNVYAFNAETLALLWQSTGPGDDSYAFSKGSPPIVANGKAYVAGLSRFISVYGPRTAAPPSPNLALNKPATGSTACAGSEGPAQAFNGSYWLGYSDKWCSKAASPWLQVDLGSPMIVNRFLIEHAGAGQEALTLNTVDFAIQISTDGLTYNTVVNVTGSADSITTHDITPTLARYVRLNVITPTSTTDPSARIYELQVFSTPDFTLSATPGTSSVVAGTAASYTTATTSTLTFNGNVNLSVSGLPAGATASFVPALIVGSGSSTLTIATTSATPPGSYPITISGMSGGLLHTATVNLLVTVNQPQDFSMAAAPGSITLAAGSGVSFTTTVSPFNFFSGAVSLAAAGLPSGAIASFSPGALSGSGTSTLNILTSASATTGTYPITITGTSGALQHVITVNLTVTASAGSNPTPVGLLSAYNVAAIYTDGTSFGTGLDSTGGAISANLVGGAQIFNGVPFTLGPPNGPNAVANATVPLPSGLFASLRILGLGVNGNQTAQTFTVNYSDGSTTSVTQSLSDWSNSQAYPGESDVLDMPYRNLSNGTIDQRVFHLYLYSIPLNATKVVSSISLPPNGNVVVLAISLVPQTPVKLSTAYNHGAFYTDGKKFSGGADGNGFGYSANLLGATELVNGVVFNLGPADLANAVVNTTVALPAGQFSTLNLLASAVNGTQKAQAITVTYTDGTTSSFTQNFSDWFTMSTFSGQSVAVNMPYRDVYNGTVDNRSFHLYSYSFALNPAKTVSSVTLPANAKVLVLSMVLAP